MSVFNPLNPLTDAAKVHLIAACHDCRHRHPIDALPGDFLQRMADWEYKHRGHRIEFRSPRRTIRSRLADKLIYPLLDRYGFVPWWLAYAPNADLKLAYAASAALTQTNLDGLASSTTFVAGWESDAIDNSSNKYLDYRINGTYTVESAGLAAGQINHYLVAELNDSAWPDVFDGTESAETVTDTNVLNAIARLAAVTATDTTASQVYYTMIPSVASVFGLVPRKFVNFVAQSTTTTLETTGDPNQVYVAGAYATSA